MWHAESWAKAFLDIVNSLLIPGIRWIHIIVIQRGKYRDSWEKNDVKEIKNRLNQLLKYGTRKKLARLNVLGITEDHLRDKRKLRELIAESFQL